MAEDNVKVNVGRRTFLGLTIGAAGYTVRALQESDTVGVTVGSGAAASEAGRVVEQITGVPGGVAKYEAAIPVDTVEKLHARQS